MSLGSPVTRILIKAGEDFLAQTAKPLRTDRDISAAPLAVADRGERTAGAALAQINDLSLQQLYVHWDGLRDGRDMPARRDLDPLQLKFIIGNLTLVEVVDAALNRFRYRLIGTNVVQRVGFDLTGRLVDEFPDPEARLDLLRDYRWVTIEKRPMVARRSHLVPQGVWGYEAVRLPLSDDGQSVNMILVGTVFVPLATPADPKRVG